MAVTESSPPPNAKYLQDDEISDECKQLLLTLPKDKGWVSSHLYQYQGFWLSPRQLQGVLNSQSHFRALPSDILLVTTPKSGTTWLKALVFALVNRHRHPVNEDLVSCHPLTTQNPHQVIPVLELTLYADNKVPDLSTLPSPRLFSSHLPVLSLPDSVRDSNCKIVYLCRDPRDAFVSLWHFTNRARHPEDEVLPLDVALERFCRGVTFYGPFYDHVLGYWNESHKRPSGVLFLKYEDIKGDTTLCVKRLAEFLECPFSPDEEKGGVVDMILKLCSFDSLSNLEVNTNGNLDSGVENKVFFRRGEVGDWVNYLTPKMIERFKKIGEDKLQGSGLEF